MLPVLPREFLWKDNKTMDEFFGMEPANEDFFEVLQSLSEEPFEVKADAVKVFNEVYYQVTRMVYEHALPADLPRFTADIKANLGWNYSAELVLTIVYFVISLIPKPKHPVNKFFMYEIKKKNESSPYWKPFDKLYYKLRKEQKQVVRPFNPTPVPARELMAIGYINWNEITRHFELGCIDHVLNLWEGKKDKELAARMILDSYYSHKGGNDNDGEQLQRYLQQYIKTEKVTAKTICIEGDFVMKNSMWDDALKARIRELETENEELKARLGKKKVATGKGRMFALVQIVDYCKNCVTWDDTKSIVAMLNKMLRIGGTQEDSDLVDSIETEFKNRLHGNTTIQGDYYAGDKVHEKNVIPNVTNYKPEITTQSIETPIPPIGPQTPKQLEDE